MRKITTSLWILCFSLFCGLTALEAQEPQQGHALCGPDCNCGCHEGNPCSCHQSCEDCCDQQDWSFLVYSPSGQDCQNLSECGCTGVWLPEEPVLFRPFLADPRQITYSVGWRFNDEVLVKNVIDISFGDDIAFYRWCNIGPWGGDLQIDLEGALWGCFDPLHDSAPLIDADYYVGFPLTYAIDRWQFRLRGYHISCHMGDEYLLNHPGFDRRNPSAEYLDFFVSHDYTDEIRLYGGVGWVVAQDDSFHIGKFYAEAGTEIRLTGLGFIDCRQHIYGVPFYGMHFRYRTHDFNRHLDATYALGYEFGKTCGLCRRLRFFIEYHDGYSPDGQFQNFATNYFSVRMSYGF